jgi:hypothetical protein
MAVIGLAAGCGHREPALSNPGMSTAKPPATSVASKERDASTRWEGMSELASFRPTGQPFLSRGHFAGQWKAQVSTNAAAAAIYTGLVQASRFSVGSVLVTKHNKKDSGAAGPIFVMVKREPGFFQAGGDWEYIVTDSDGWIEDRGPLTLCARCHAEAVADWVFGLPLEAR